MLKFQPSDWDWSDVHKGLTPEQTERLQLVVAEILNRVSEMTAPHDITVEVPLGHFSVGVQGDERTYTPIVMLKGPNPGWDVIAEISSRISNSLPVNRVTFEQQSR